MLNDLRCSSCKAGILCQCKSNKNKKRENVNHPDHYLKNSGHEDEKNKPVPVVLIFVAMLAMACGCIGCVVNLSKSPGWTYLYRASRSRQQRQPRMTYSNAPDTITL